MQSAHVTARAVHPFLVGANLPWLRYGLDFGANAWQPRGGFRARGDAEQLRRVLQDLVPLGLRAIRWFVLCDGRAGVRFDADGVPLGLDEACAEDLDHALLAAREAGVGVMPVLLDFHWCRPARTVDGVVLGGHRDTIREPARRAALVDRVLAPLVARHGRNETVLAWDLMNEPEWVTWSLGTWRPGAVRVREMRAFLGAAVEAVHGAASQPVTVGSASARWLSLVRGLGLDLYQPHWYDALDPPAPLGTPVDRLDLDRPVWLGEFPTRGSARTPASIVAAARGAGYAGAWFWSIAARDEHSDCAAAAEAVTRT